MQTNSIEKNITKDIILKCNPCQKKKKKKKKRCRDTTLEKEDQSRVCVWAMSSLLGVW